jgi:hypothetical protein
MIRQYHAQRRRGVANPLGVGVIPAGAIFYLQDPGWWRDHYRGAPMCRNPLDRRSLPQRHARRRPPQTRSPHRLIFGQTFEHSMNGSFSGRRGLT